ncbi:hypothetical protein FACS189430_06430 [Bacteroidia bacterium]|nr:hypothetical protein FACS189430_06430 [Bacteroidia bacterium]
MQINDYPIYNAFSKFMQEDRNAAKLFCLEMQQNMQDEDFFFEPIKENARKLAELEKENIELKSVVEDKDRLIAELMKKNKKQ